MQIIGTQIDKFTRAYIEAALWSSTDDDGDPLDASFSIDDIHPATLNRMIEDCLAFQETEEAALRPLGSVEQNGHDFWLTRNRHGAGFWDRGYKDFCEIACAPCDYYKLHPIARYVKAVVDSSHAYGEFDLYVGDDGLIHAGGVE